MFFGAEPVGAAVKVNGTDEESGDNEDHDVRGINPQQPVVCIAADGRQLPACTIAETKGLYNRKPERTKNRVRPWLQSEKRISNGPVCTWNEVVKARW